LSLLLYHANVPDLNHAIAIARYYFLSLKLSVAVINLL
jgi:hypothetical protein